MYKVGICGHFAFGKNLLNGQTVKTKIIAEELCNQYGEAAVKKIDTHGGMKQILLSVLDAAKAMFTCHNLIILPAHNGVRVFGPVLSVLKCFSKCKLHYAVIGGWLPQLVAKSSCLRYALKRFDFIYVETTTMRKALESIGFQNVIVMPNCKNLPILKETELIYHSEAPYPLCTFSRVMQEKGIEDAVAAVKAVNDEAGEVRFTLDVYGPVDSGYQERFEEQMKQWPHYIRYAGTVDSDKSVQLLKNYFVLLFPTRFFTEGIPGTIVDAYAAGIPVIASRWESFSDIVKENITGKGYQFGDVAELSACIKAAAVEPQFYSNMKAACLDAAYEYTTKAIHEIMGARI